MNQSFNIPPFLPGDRVVCVDGALWMINGEFVPGPKTGEVDIISSCFKSEGEHGWAVRLKRFDGSIPENKGYGYLCFRKIQESGLPLIKLSQIQEKERTKEYNQEILAEN